MKTQLLSMLITATIFGGALFASTQLRVRNPFPSDKTGQVEEPIPEPEPKDGDCCKLFTNMGNMSYTDYVLYLSEKEELTDQEMVEFMIIMGM